MFLQRVLISKESGYLLVPALKVSIGDLHSPKHLMVLSYPSRDLEVAEKRLLELKSMGVTHLEFSGETRIDGVGVLGKGTTSMVVKAWLDSDRVAAKILRTDSNRLSVLPEVQKVMIANKRGVGPKLIDYGEEVFLMEYVDGRRISDAIVDILGRSPGERESALREIVGEVLSQCFALDRIGLDHGQLHRPDKHIYIIGDGEVKIIDFETASLMRRPANVTSIVHFLLAGSPKAKKLMESLGISSREDIYPLLRRYKDEPVQGTFKEVLRILQIPVG
jgi:putative serine/threonine protein kinase